MGWLKKFFKNPLGAVGDVFDGIGDAISKVGNAVGDVIQGAINDPLGTIVTIAAYAAAPATGGTSLYAIPALSAGRVLDNGGSFSDALKGAAISYAASQAAGGVGKFLPAAAQGSAQAFGNALAKSTTSNIASQLMRTGDVDWDNVAKSLAGAGLYQGIHYGFDELGNAVSTITGESLVNPDGSINQEAINNMANAYGNQEVGVDIDAFGREIGSSSNPYASALIDEKALQGIADLSSKGLGFGTDYTLVGSGNNLGFKAANNDIIWDSSQGTNEEAITDYKNSQTLKLLNSGDFDYSGASQLINENSGFSQDLINTINKFENEGFEFGRDFSVDESGDLIDADGNVLFSDVFGQDSEKLYQRNIENLRARGEDLGQGLKTDGLMPNLADMGGGQGLTADVEGGAVGQEGFTPDNAVPIIGDPDSFINDPNVIGTPVVQEGSPEESEIYKATKKFFQDQLTKNLVGGIMGNTSGGRSSPSNTPAARTGSNTDQLIQSLFGPGASSDLEVSSLLESAPAVDSQPIELFDPLGSATWAPQSKIGGLGFAGKYLNPESDNYYVSKEQEDRQKRLEELQSEQGWMTDEDRQRSLEQDGSQNGGQTSPFYDFNTGGFDPNQITYAADGGLMGHNPEFYSEGGASLGNRYVKGRGDGTSDSVPAMLASGEFVIPADVVSGLGNGDNDAGAKVLDSFMEEIRKHKRGGSPKQLPPDSLGPLSYLSSAMTKAKRK